MIFEIGTLQFAKNEFLTDTMNFGSGFSFPKGPCSAFSEGLHVWFRVHFIKYAQIWEKS